MSDYLVDPKAAADPAIEALEATLGAAAYRGELDWERATAALASERTRRRRRAWITVGVAVAAAAAVVVFVVVRGGRNLASDPIAQAGCAAAGNLAPWRVEGVAGAPRCGGSGFTAAVTLAEGAWLETDAESRARVQVASVGELDILPGTRLRLDSAAPDEHRFSLERGHIHAAVDAPPRLFVVTTPLATAVDLGCEYDLRVDADGLADLVVSGGAVSLEGGGRAVTVLEGYRAVTIPEHGPTPAVPQDESEAFMKAVIEYTRGGGEAALAEILATDNAAATATLIGILQLTLAKSQRDQCERVHARLIELSPMPFPWESTSYGCDDIGELIEAWQNLLQQTW